MQKLDLTPKERQDIEDMLVAWFRAITGVDHEKVLLRHWYHNNVSQLYIFDVWYDNSTIFLHVIGGDALNSNEFITIESVQVTSQEDINNVIHTVDKMARIFHLDAFYEFHALGLYEQRQEEFRCIQKPNYYA